jgi:uncharacterized protein YbaA (DUF1428 family)
MSYVEGFVIAVPRSNKQKFIDHADCVDAIFIEWGATRAEECWEYDVPDGQITDFRGGVQAAEDEAVVFSWIEWPDKSPPDAATELLMDENNRDPRLDSEKNPMPYDGKRMIFGGVSPVVDLVKA